MLQSGAQAIGMPWWLGGLLIDGMYLSAAWVVSVMLPPMAIFFPLFTLLEDFGYLPRVAFNLDNLFKKSGAHGKQSLSMMMGFGCNAAGVIAARVIDSPRERLIAILTNNFALCNGRWPTQFLLARAFVVELPPYRAPRILQTIYTSVIDRTLLVLNRAVVFALPAGAVIWLLANLRLGGASLAEQVIAALDPAGLLLGLNGVILLAYI